MRDARTLLTAICRTGISTRRMRASGGLTTTDPSGGRPERVGPFSAPRRVPHRRRKAGAWASRPAGAGGGADSSGAGWRGWRVSVSANTGWRGCGRGEGSFRNPPLRVSCGFLRPRFRWSRFRPRSTFARRPCSLRVPGSCGRVRVPVARDVRGPHDVRLRVRRTSVSCPCRMLGSSSPFVTSFGLLVGISGLCQKGVT